MTPLRYILASLWHHRRVHLAVAAGVAVATAVIAGALLVGDSVRGSLRDLVLERLGNIDQVLVAEQPFRADLATELGAERTAPLLLVPGSLAATNNESSRRATQLSIIGHTDAFWQLGAGAPPSPLSRNQMALSGSVAAELDVGVGDEVLLRVPLTGSMPAESVLGEKADTTTARRLVVSAILADKGLARFSLRPSQQPPRNVFLSLQTLQDLLGLVDRANAVAIVGNNVALQPRLDDFGVSVSDVNLGTSSYVRVTADRLVLPTALVAACKAAFPETTLQPAITYLANTIKVGERQVPYSTISGVDSLPATGPLLDTEGQAIVLADDEIALNDWAAKALSAEVGDQVAVTYYQPETTHGQLREGEPLTLRLRAIVALVDQQGIITPANDPQLTPELPGVTDQQSINDWDLPFELVEPIRSADEDYWDAYTTTPKAFVSHQLAKKLWSTRWGTESVVRFPAGSGVSVDAVRKLVQPDPAAMGMSLLAVKTQGLAAARGTTAFEGLFLGFSFFLMASAVMLIALLFRLGAEGRAAELGVLTAIGFSARQSRYYWLSEAALVALVGAAIGVAAGICYARLMIHGLSTWWVAATVTPFLELHVNPRSLAIGFFIGLLVALLTIAWTLRKLLKLPARQLLTGDSSDPADLTNSVGFRWLPFSLIAAAMLLGIFATRLEGEAQAGAFFGSGSLVLTALLLWLRQRLRLAAWTKPQSMSLAGLSARNARRYPSRTLLSVGLAAVASFLIVALSAFRLAPTEQGTGGFQLIATSDLPLHFDLNTSAGREELGFGSRENHQLDDSQVVSFRVRAGEDASCLNLYQSAQPQIVGVPLEFSAERQFGWSAKTKSANANASPWELLNDNPTKGLGNDLGVDDSGRPVVPMILDKNTAVYSLHLAGVGARMTVNDAFDQPVTLEVVALLSNSVLQGKVMIGDADFLQLFPDASGSQMFLIRAAERPADLAALLETQLEDYGFDAVSTEERLAGFLAVQNTYLSTFQSLGALGLLLGTIGLAVAQLRSVLERRSEIALLRSAGFRRSRLAKMVLGENTLLLVGGLAIGTFAATVAVLPHYLLQEANTPWSTLAVLLATVFVAGLLAGWLAVRTAVKVPLLPALRGE